MLEILQLVRQQTDGHLHIRSLAKGTLGIGTFSTVLAKATVAKECQLFVADFLPSQDARQHQVQHGYAMKKSAGGHP